jgi:ubiquinol oxidase
MRKIISKILNPIISFSLKIVVFLFGLVYKYDSYRRYFVLETIARIPYFCYLASLHLYQTWGSHPSLKLMDLHYKENKNEEYHLLIMEALGGGDVWFDRVLAYILGFLYYGVNLVLYWIAPASAYYLMQLIETEAVHSYSEILKLKEKELTDSKVPEIAIEYFYSNQVRMTESPQKQDKITLYQVFESIKQDEQVHVVDMTKCGNMPSLYTRTPGAELA